MMHTRARTAMLAAAAMGLGLAAAPAQAKEVTVVGKEFKFQPKRIEAEIGETVEIRFENDGRLSHNLTFKGLEAKTETIQAGNTTTVTVTPDSAGTYRFVCTVPGHAQAGMKGRLVVGE